jgi:hypothetical protein
VWFRVFFVTLILISIAASGQNNLDEFLRFVKGRDPLVDQVLAEKEKFRLQFIASAISHEYEDFVEFEDFSYLNKSYFYPASLVKLPTAVATLEILDSLAIPLRARLVMNEDAGCGNNSFSRLTKPSGLPFSGILEDMISISDNGYFSLLFHFTGPEELNDRMHSRNLNNVKIFSSYAGCPTQVDVLTNSYSVMESGGEILFSKPALRYPYVKFKSLLPPDKRKRIGSRHFSGGELVNGPIDFSDKHEYGLHEIHQTMKRVFFPENFAERERFQISEDSRQYLMRCLGKYPREMLNPAYHNPVQFPDNYFKYVVIGEDSIRKKNDRFRVFSKIGISYGFVTESAYVVDFQSKKDFLFSISIYVNANDVINDGRYEYNEIARPFISRLSGFFLEYIKSKPNSYRCPEEYLEGIQWTMQP